MYRHAPIHESLPLLGEYTFSAVELPHRLITFLNKTLKRRGIIFGLTQIAPREFKLSIYDLVLKEAEERTVRSAAEQALKETAPENGDADEPDPDQPR